MSNWHFRADADYWDLKLSTYLHDPPDKALSIPGHEARSRLLAEVLGPLPAPDSDMYRRADAIAAGMDRAQLPPHDADPRRSGSIDFLAEPKLTHPTGDSAALQVHLSPGLKAAEMNQALVELANKDIHCLSEAPGFKGNPAALAAARFHYVHHALRERLARRNAGGLGGLWHRLPADTRIPDHSIWQHCSLVSALTSCFALSPRKGASLLVFALTPVQDFLSRARKLRDFWSGSLILSWLAFEGMRPVIYELGTDHIIYPSLIGQPLVNRLLDRECRFGLLPDGWAEMRAKAGVASLPNKFVCLVPTGEESAIAEKSQQSVQAAWQDLGSRTLALMEAKLARRDGYLKEQFRRQLSGFWEYHWAAAPLVEESGILEVQKLLPAAVWKRPLAMLAKVKEQKCSSPGEGALYALTHALSQGFLAAGKATRTNRGELEKGIKCSLHGDLETLRFAWGEGEDRNPRPAQDPLWSELKRGWQPESDFKPTERLSAVATVKRLAYRVCKDHPDHPLNPFFAAGETFPSTTEMALDDWFRQVAELGLLQNFPELQKKGWRRVLSQVVHEQEGDTPRPESEPEILSLDREERKAARRLLEAMEKAKAPVRDEDKYYALLLMDGDRMGMLVNGATLASRWETVLHPQLVERLKQPQFPKQYREFWQGELNQPRALAPAVHAAISESLGDFSLFTVPALVEKHRGRLIYAGGDDVCALLPVSTALAAAQDIAQWYSQAFLFFPAESPGLPLSLSGVWEPSPGRLALHLGAGKDISISAGLVIAHHKAPLAAVIRRGHRLLKLAKEKGGRNAVALELRKRAGGPALFLARWAEEPWPDLGLELPGEKRRLVGLLEEVANYLGRPPYRELSASLIYRLQELQPGLQALAGQAPAEVANFLRAQVQRSQKEEDQVSAAHLAHRLAALMVRPPASVTSTPSLTIEPLLIARFLGARRSMGVAGKGGA
jgi:CRISPR-associated protein Cmr2